VGTGENLDHYCKKPDFFKKVGFLSSLALIEYDDFRAKITVVTASLLLSTMQPGQLLCDRYRVEKALAAGGFGETFLAVDTHLPSKPQVVVKLLKPINNDPATLKIAQRLFNTEAETLEKLGKDNDRIPSLYAYFELRGEFYLVQEYIAGTTLTGELQGRKIPESDTLDILKEILTGLTKVHSQNIIHRDLKPDNIIRRGIDRKLVLIDFGAVKQVRAATVTTPNPSVSRTIGIGTEGYMPSEQGIGYPKPASDIYAVGAIAIQCLTGSAPHLLFDEDSLKLEWQHLRQVNRDLVQVLDKMVAPDYRQRYANATEALRAIESLISPSASPQIPPPIPVPIPIPIPVPVPIPPPIPIPTPVIPTVPTKPVIRSLPSQPVRSHVNQGIKPPSQKPIQQPVNKGLQPPAKTPPVNSAQPSRSKGMKNKPKKSIQQIFLISMTGVGLVSALVSFGGLFSTVSNRSPDVSISSSNSPESSSIEIPLQSSSLPSASPKAVKSTPTPTPTPSPSESPKSDSSAKVIEEGKETEGTKYKVLELNNYKLDNGEKFQNINNSKMTLKTNGGDHTYYIINSQGWLTATDTESVLAVPDNSSDGERHIKDNTNEYQIINKHLRKYGRECLHDEHEYASHKGCLLGIVQSEGKNELRGSDFSGDYYRQNISIVTIYMPVKVRRNSAKLKDFKKDLKLAISEINKRRSKAWKDMKKEQLKFVSEREKEKRLEEERSKFYNENK
jgi:serine/threonine protein kinase